MKKQDILSIVMTFFVGVLAGSYLYIVGFAPTVATLAVPSQEKLDALVIESDVYGGCRDDCPSFQLLGDGSYRYLYTSDLSEPQSIADGKIPDIHDGIVSYWIFSFVFCLTWEQAQ